MLRYEKRRQGNCWHELQRHYRAIQWKHKVAQAGEQNKKSSPAEAEPQYVTTDGEVWVALAGMAAWAEAPEDTEV